MTQAELSSDCSLLLQNCVLAVIFLDIPAIICQSKAYYGRTDDANTKNIHLEKANFWLA